MLVRGHDLRHSMQIIPILIILIFILLFLLYNNFKFPGITVLGVVLSAPIGGILALKLTGTPFSVSSGIGFLALFGVSVQTAVVYISYVNELRLAGTPVREAIREAAILRLRPIMMTALVAALRQVADPEPEDHRMRPISRRQCLASVAALPSAGVVLAAGLRAPERLISSASGADAFPQQDPDVVRAMVIASRFDRNREGN